VRKLCDGEREQRARVCDPTRPPLCSLLSTPHTHRAAKPGRPGRRHRLRQRAARYLDLALHVGAHVLGNDAATREVERWWWWWWVEVVESVLSPSIFSQPQTAAPSS